MFRVYVAMLDCSCLGLGLYCQVQFCFFFSFLFFFSLLLSLRECRKTHGSVSDVSFTGQRQTFVAFSVFGKRNLKSVCSGLSALYVLHD